MSAALPDRLNNSNTWDEYDGISNHHKILDSNANFEQFEVTSTDKKLHIKAPDAAPVQSRTRASGASISSMLDNGTLDTPPVVGGFNGKRGEFFHQENFKGRTILVRYVWLDHFAEVVAHGAVFSPDGGKTWEVNWICELSR